MKKLISLMISMVMIFGSVSFASNYNNQLNNVNKNIKNVKDEIKDKQNVVKDINKIILELDAKIDESEQKISVIQNDIAKTQAEIDVTQKEITKLEDNIDTNTDLLGSRLRVMYRTSDIDYFQILLNSSDMDELLSNMTMIKKIVKNDKEILADLKEQKDSVETKKISLQKEEKRMSTFKASLESEQKVLEKNMQEQNSNKQMVVKDIEKLKQMEDALIKEANDLQSKIRELQKTKGIGGNYKGGVMAWPVSGGGRVTSSFGYRIHPILKEKKLHTGMDIAAPSGTGIFAANDGRVIFAGTKGSYGKAVIVDHGGGIVTLYAHCSSILVSDGQDVKKGETIAKVGSTGYSTGPHLHFEVRVNGDYVNPASYIGG